VSEREEYEAWAKPLTYVPTPWETWQAARRTVSGQEAAKWIHELRRAHEYLDKGEPFFTGKDCAELADLIESIAAPISAAGAP
jgi:hypothetical protein